MLVRVGGPGLNWRGVSVGNETCAIRGDGSLWCWANIGSPLGDGSTGMADPVGGGVPPVLTPTQIGADTNWVGVTTQGSRSCATKTDGSLWCWGLDATITPHYRTSPVLIN
jgi:hypothetical protein